jgi:hypothetical protein
VAAEASRAAVLELSQAAGEVVVAHATAAAGIDAMSVRVGWCGAVPGSLGSHTGSCPLTRGSVVSITIEVWAPLIDTPWGAVGGIWVSAGHTEPIDLYRSLG